jgi:uncharacterized membrane protein YbhN (UPF0104 family)
MLLLTPPVLYVLLGVLRRRPIPLGPWATADGPSPLGLAANGMVGALDWVMASVVLYALLPPGVDARIRPDTAGIFLVAQLVGLLSHVPGWSGRVRVPDACCCCAIRSRRRICSARSWPIASIYYLLPLGAGGDHARCLRIAPSAGAGTVVAAHGGAVGAGAYCRMSFAFLALISGAVLLVLSRDSSGASALGLAGRFATAVGAGSFAFCQQLDWDEFVVARTRFATPAGCRLVVGVSFFLLPASSLRC